MWREIPYNFNEGKQPAPGMLSNRDVEIIFNKIKDNFTIGEVGRYEEMSPARNGDYAFYFEKAVFILDPIEKTLTVDVAVPYVENWFEFETKDLIETKVLSVDIS